jgi:hypothetical protein
MRTLNPVLTFLILILILHSDVCQAQGMFGERRLGSALSRQARPGASAAAPGVVNGGRRFLRDQRAVTDFVGSAIAQEAAANFVGGQSAVTSAVSSVTGLVEEFRPPMNRPRIVRPSGLYAERLTLSSDTLSNSESPQSDVELAAAALSPSLRSFIQSRSVTIEVFPADHSATLRGAVPSEHDRQTTELFVLLEPGIQIVRNELTVDPALPPAVRRSRLPKSN